MIYLHSLEIKGKGGYKLFNSSKFVIEHWIKPVTVLIGENGSGKSTLLECITWIFRGLHERFVMERKDTKLPFDFELIYVISNETTSYAHAMPEVSTTYVEVKASGKMEGDKYDIAMENVVLMGAGDDLKPVLQRTSVEDFKTLVPNIVVYYSGLSESIEAIYTDFERAYRTSLLPDRRQSQDAYAKLRVFPLYYLERGHFQLLLAALYSYEFSVSIDDFFENRLGIQKPEKDCIKIVISHHQYKSKQGSDTFWGAEGELGAFLQQIRACASEEKENSDQSLTFWFDLEGWYSLRAFYVEERLLLTLLLLLQSEGRISSLEVFFNIGSSKRVSHLALSEGQQQLITLRALNELMVDKNTLFLFDEPDTYLHPRWQAEFMLEIEPFSERATFMITTHSPIILANFKDGNLFGMKKGEAKLIDGYYYGRTYNDNLRDVMHTPTRPEETTKQFLLLYDLIDRSQWQEASDQAEVLRDMVGPDDTELVQAETMIDFMKPEN